MEFYNRYSDYLKKKYGEKVYKLPINLDITCPNRDGTLSYKGCSFCSAKGTGFESLENTLSVTEQLQNNMDYIGKRYKAKKFIAYFQNYTNTYMPLDKFTDYITMACVKDVVEIDISTRPDCIVKEQLDFLKDLSIKKGINITFELGLQTSNDETLLKINRGHTVKDFIDAVVMIKKYDFEICTHLILNLPWDNLDTILNNATLLNETGVDQVKIHSLYIAKGTPFERMYLNNEFDICTKEEYIYRVVYFLENLNSSIVVQRLLGRAPKEDTCFCNWDTSWWKIKDEIIEYMEKNGCYQGRLYQNEG